MRIVRKDFVDIGKLLALAACAWVLPERFWAAFCRRFAAIESGVQRTLTRGSVEHIRRACSFHPVRTGPGGIHSGALAAHYLERVHILACYRPWNWTPAIELHGFQHLTDALSRGGGAILWVGNFYFSNLVTKMAFQRRGVDVTHLSRPTHGFSRTEFGIRWLNRIRTRVEDRYLHERVVVGSGEKGESHRRLRRRLATNGVVSITVGQWAKEVVRTPLLAAQLSLATGPARLAIETGASLLPVFTVADGRGAFHVYLESPLTVRDPGNVDGSIRAIVREYAARLEPYVLSYPELWRTWSRLRFE
jgi:lauroyl/myristoyl acyltransferase